MRRFCFILLVIALVAPAAAFAGDRAAGATGDGSLVVTDANGTVIVQGKGVIFGHFVQGQLTVIDYRPDDPTNSLTASGAKGRVLHIGAGYAGSDIRFLLPAGRYTIQLVGFGLDISAVGKGNVSATGAGTGDDGSFAVNGGKPQPLPKASAAQIFGVKSL